MLVWCICTLALGFQARFIPCLLRVVPMCIALVSRGDCLDCSSTSVLHAICFARCSFGVFISCAVLFWVFRRVLFRVCFARCQTYVFRIVLASCGACLGLSSTYCYEFVSRGICLVFLYRVYSTQGLFVSQACINHRKSTRPTCTGSSQTKTEIRNP